MNDLASVVESARADFARAAAPAELEDAKARYLGKTGVVTERLKSLGALPVDEKKARGAEINVAKQAIEAALVERRADLANRLLEAQLAAQALDVTLPGRSRGRGGIHPVSRALERIEAIFASMGFEVADGPEIETDWYSFTALNNPDNHPARSMQDTFYVDVKDGKSDWLMKPVLSTTGAIRLEDVKGETLMVQISSKSMLLNVKTGHRIVDDCISPKQRELNEAAKAAKAASASS